MIATGNDDFAQQLAERIGQFILDTEANRPRSLQKAIGPSGVGNPCDRALAYQLLDWPEINHNRDPIAAIIGTGFHMWMAEAFEARNANDRYKVEQRVTVREGYTEAAQITGSSDLYDRLLSNSIDWKLTGVSSLDEYRRRGPGEQYRIQGHLYGLGQENAGETPARVTVVFVGRYHELRVHVWSEPYDRQVALDALARLDRIRQQVMDLDPEANPDRWSQISTPQKPKCRFCAWFKPGSTDLSVGCPGVVPEAKSNALESLIA